MVESLEFEDVIARFRESEAVLTELGEKLSVLHEQYEEAKSRTESLAATAKSVDDYSQQAITLLEEVNNLIANNKELVRVGQELLSTNSLSELQASVNRIEESTKALDEALATTNQKLPGKSLVLLGLTAVIILQAVVILQEFIAN